MAYIIASLFWILGIIIGSMGLVQMMIILFFSIPYTKLLNGFGLLNNVGTLYKRDIASVVVWIFIISGVSTLVYLFASQLSLIFYLIGVGISVLLGVGKTGGTETNVQEYYSNNYGFFNLDGLKNINENTANKILDSLNKVHKEKGMI